ncbi:hypothetical protein [Streptomyces hirsutus]|uniref:hypothetical protein n=1 Tax=Streptomyces hirsutus TaxID=35620 RepID=UPI0006E20D0F|nr:hypothetical protein [Streptomyces hirsutus]
MLKLSKVMVATAIAAVGTAAPLVLASPAAAAGGTAPACIERYVSPAPGGGGVVDLYNTCGRSMRVQIVYTNGATGTCYTLADGAAKTLTYSYPRVYARTAVC